MSTFDEDQTPPEPASPDKAKFSKVLSLGSFAGVAAGKPQQPKQVSDRPGNAVTVEVKRKRQPFTGGLAPDKNYAAGFSPEDLRAKVGLIVQAEKDAHANTLLKEQIQAQKEAAEAENNAKASRSTPAPGAAPPASIKTTAWTPTPAVNRPYKPQIRVDEAEQSAKDAAEKLKESLKIKLATKGRRESKRVIIQNIDSDEGQPIKRRSVASIKRRQEKFRNRADEKPKARDKLLHEIVIPEHITVADLADRMAEKASDVIMKLMKMGVMATINQLIDSDTAELVVSEFGHKAKVVRGADVEDVLLDDSKDAGAEQFTRAPVVTVMGHIDHGKTSLLDALRSTDTIAGEAGGITQHIGAYQVQLRNNEKITFIDTPGHAVFTSMRLRGARITDIVILVVAADDGIKEQTIESINHAKAAKVPIIVAINKMDKQGANPQRILSDLLSHGCVADSMGGDVMTVEVSALKKQGLDKLEDAILLQAELLDLKARTAGRANGAVIESRIDKAKGVIATVLVQQGTLKIGDIMVAGHSSGRVRTMRDDRGHYIKEALPSTPVEITGLETAPMAGDTFSALHEEKHARDVSDYRLKVIKKQRDTDSAAANTVTMETVFTQTGTTLELPLIVKADTQGSVEAICASLNKLSTEKVKTIILHKAVGGVNESDATLAKASKAIILAFNVGTDSKGKTMIQQTGVDLRSYSIIYNLIQDVKALMEGKLSPIKKEKYLGRAEVRQVFVVSKSGKIGGGIVTDGLLRRNAAVKLLRDNVVVHEGTLKTLKRFKEDAKEVSAGYECGFTIDKFSDMKEGDIIECFEIIEEKDTL